MRQGPLPRTQFPCHAAEGYGKHSGQRKPQSSVGAPGAGPWPGPTPARNRAGSLMSHSRTLRSGRFGEFHPSLLKKFKKKVLTPEKLEFGIHAPPGSKTGPKDFYPVDALSGQDPDNHKKQTKITGRERKHKQSMYPLNQLKNV